MTKDGMTALHDASKTGNVGCVKALLKDSHPEYREMANKDGYTPLHFAVWKRYSEVVVLLLKDSRPELREIANKHGNTALHFASDRGSVACVAPLLKDSRSQYREIRNKKGKRPIDLTHNITVIRLLLEAKYIPMVLSNTLTKLFVVDEKYLFWSDDSIIKDTLLWIIGDEYFDE